MAEGLGAGIPEILKHYRLVRRLGSGGMGSVFEAVDRRDDSRVAVKLLHPHLATDESFRERFEREAHVAALLRSPYTVHLLDFGYAEGFYFLVMEFVEGRSVAQLLHEEGRLEPKRALMIAADAARALEESAARGIIHRDIKPDNILVEPDGTVKVADFGIARRAGSGGDLTIPGGFVGTTAYAAPEQAMGGEVTHSVDIYALGATLFCMLTGQPPFAGSTPFELVRQHREAPVPMGPLAGLPDPVINIVRRSMEKDPEDRYRSASEMVGAIERALRNLTASGSRQQPIPLEPTIAAPIPETQVAPLAAPPAPPAPPSAPGVVAGPEQATAVAEAPAASAGGAVLPTAAAQSGEVATAVGSSAGTPAQGIAGVPPAPPAAPVAGGRGGGGNRNVLFAVIGVAAVLLIGAAAAFFALSGGDNGDAANDDDDDDNTPTSRQLTRTVATQTARAHATRDARQTATAEAAPTDTPEPTATPTTTPTLAPAGFITTGQWTFNFRVVENTCPDGVQVGERIDISYELVDSDGDGRATAGESVTVVDGVSGNTVGPYTFTYPDWTFEAGLEGGDFLTWQHSYFSDSSGSSRREEHYTTDNGECVIAFEDP